jgi:hypothetical protein
MRFSAVALQVTDEPKVQVGPGNPPEEKEGKSLIMRALHPRTSHSGPEPSPAKAPPAFQLRLSGPARPMPAESIDFSAKKPPKWRASRYHVPFRKVGSATARPENPRFVDAQDTDGKVDVESVCRY